MYYLMLICAVASTVMTVMWLFLFLRYRKKYDKILEDVDGKIFTLKDIYFIGLGAIEIFERTKKKKITVSDKAVDEMKLLAEVFGRDKAELYYYISAASKVSLILTFAPIGLMMTCLLKSVLGLLLGAVLAFVLPRGVQSGINKAIQAKKDEILNEFPKMVSKLTMLVNAGMLLRPAWDEVAESNHEDALYAEMRLASKDILEGKTIEAAMDSFAARCGLKEIRKFASIYVQAVKRGAGESIDSMKIMAEEAWEQKKQLSKQKGEIAAQKLLIPNVIMFFGIMLVVVVPMVAAMLSNFNL